MKARPQRGTAKTERHAFSARSSFLTIRLEVKDGKVYIEGEPMKRFGFHTFRHSLTSWLMANGENPQIVRAMLRWTNLNMLAHYTHGFKADKLEAQGAVLKKLVRSGPPTDRESERESEESKSS